MCPANGYLSDCDIAEASLYILGGTRLLEYMMLKTLVNTNKSRLADCQLHSYRCEHTGDKYVPLTGALTRNRLGPKLA